MKDYVLILIIIVGTILAKVFANYHNYKYDTVENKKVRGMHGILQHLFELLMIGVPFTMGLIGLTVEQWLVALASFALIYAFLMSTGYNILRKLHLHYIGFTDPIDKWLRRTFNILDEYADDYKDKTAKEKQSSNFRKGIIFMIKVVFGVSGFILLKELI